MKKILLFCCTLFLLCGVNGQGHIYPVQANVNVVAPYSLYLSDYVSGSKERLIVTLLNRDVQYPSMPVRLRLSIKGNGFSIQTRPYASVSPITLEPNVPYKLTVDDLMPYFDTRNLSAQGLGGDSYLRGGRLPEGMIEFGIEVLEYGTLKVLSQRATGTAWLSLQKPPVLSLPFQDEVIPWREPLNLLFQWTPQHSGVARVEYELLIRELWDNGLAPESAFAWSPEIFHERITSTSYLYGALAPALEPGRRYAWAVRVVAKDGADDVSIFENEGLSMIRSFRIARYCPEPVQVKATAERGYIHVEWESAPEHIDYTVAYRVKGAETWAEVRSTFPSALLSGVRPGYTYEYRVGGFCEPLVPTFGKTAFLTLPSEDTTRLRNCGMLRPVDLSNQDPLDELLNGDQFIAGDFPVHVQEVTGSQGFFTGNGYVHVPFLAYAPFKVTFDNVYINTDRRMIRGVVNTVYDPAEGGLGNLDDIFTGGGHTGHVVEGITKTDLSADFVIDKDNGFFFDETTGKIEVTDESGQVIGYIETGHLATGGGDSGGNAGNAPSVFPMTVKDSEGNIYEVEEAPEDGSGTENEGDGENPGSGSKKQLVVTPVGKSGDGLDGDKVNFKRLDNRLAEVVFTDTEGSLYAFDAWKAVYSGSYLIRTKYEQLGESYRVPAKLIPSGKRDKVGAVITVHDPSVDAEKVIFKTREGTEFKWEKFDKTTGRYVLNLVGGNANDGQELYALYPKPGGGYYNLGKLLIVSYPSYRIKVKIVPVANDLDEFEALRGELEKIYSRVGIECVVEKMPVFAYSSPLLFADKSGVFSAYTDEMKKLQGAYVENYGIDPEASYLFVLLYSGQGDDRNYTGFMPLNKQFGYLFRRDFGSFEEFAVAAAHELAHGRLSLRHPFDKSLGLPEGSVSDNLMDYRNGRELAKWQWDVIHDPGIVLRVFERDEDAAIQQNQDTTNQQIKIEMYNDGKKFEKGSYQLISAHPQMPELSFKVTDNSDNSDKVKFQLKIEYRRDNRSDEDYFPEKDKFAEIDAGSSWVVDWQDKIRGGKATLFCHTDDNKDTLVFYIRGTNPTEQEIKNFLLQEGYSTETWFLTRLIRQESQYRQFNPGTKYGSAWTSSVGCPNWGTPHGWGLMQLDVLNSSCGELHRDGKYRPSAEALWNWKENLKVGYAFLTGEKKSIARTHITKMNKIVEEWNNQSINDLVDNHTDQVEGTQTFTHASSSQFNFDWGTLNVNLRSFIDGVWMKSYNGNTPNYYYYLIVSKNAKEKPYWELSRENNSNHNYVGAICGQNE